VRHLLSRDIKWSLFMILTIIATSSQPLLSSEYTILEVYRDGYVKVTMVIPVGDQTVLNVTLMGTPSYLLVLDEKGLPLEYNISSGVISILCIDTPRVTLTYYTPNLTEKHEGLWNLTVNMKLLNVTVILPEDSILMACRPLPWKVKAENNTLVLVYTRTPLSLEYVILPMPETGRSEGAEAPQGKEEAPVEVITNEGKREGGQDTLLLAAGLSMASMAIVVLAYKLKRRKYMEFLTEEEKTILDAIRARGGQAYLTEIVKAVNLPKTTVWRRIRKLEEFNIVRTVRTRRGLLVRIK